MSAYHTIPNFSERIVTHLEINAADPLSQALVADVNRACDSAEDAGQGSIMLVRLDGCKALAFEGANPGANTHMVNQWERALRRMERLAAVTVTIADGVCGGLGLAVLLATDYRIVNGNIRLSLAGPSGEIFPGMGVYRLANQIGVAWSRRLVLFGAEITAAKAAELGLIDEVVDDIATSVANFSESLKQVDLAQLAIRRQLLLEASAKSFEDALGTHLAACDRALRHTQHSIMVSGHVAEDNMKVGLG